MLEAHTQESCIALAASTYARMDLRADKTRIDSLTHGEDPWETQRGRTLHPNGFRRHPRLDAYRQLLYNLQSLGFDFDWLKVGQTRRWASSVGFNRKPV